MIAFTILGPLCAVAIAYAFGWSTRARRPRTDLHEVRDCAGTSPCSTCQDKRECGRTGCVRPSGVMEPLKDKP